MPSSRGPRTSPLPPRAFLVGEGMRGELSRRQLRHPRFEAPHRGVRRLKDDARSAHLRERVARAAADYLPLLRRERREAFSHTTALHLYGAPIRTPVEVHVSIAAPHGPARGRNVLGHHHGARVRPRALRVAGAATALPCVPPATALIQSASLLSFREQVVAIDHLVRVRGRAGGEWSLAELHDLAAAVADSSARGILRLRAALSVARIGAESRMESLQHFELARMGVDTLELQADLHDREGVWIGRFDSVDRVKRRILEYDGEQHRIDRAQYLHDERRLDRARDEGYRVMRTHYEDFRPEALERTRAGLCEFLQCRPRPIPAWLERYFAEPY